MNIYELIAFIAYFVIVISVGLVFFFKGLSKPEESGEKSYFLGGRDMSGPVAALSAGASDMSAWVLMGLPGAIYLFGFGQIWISVGLALGTALAWIFIAPRLRTFSIKANDSITIPQFLTNRFLSKSKALQIICAIVFIFVYTVYSASSICACGDLFQTVFNLDSKVLPMVISAAIIVVYTFLGGFNAVCWTDFFQGLLMLAALMFAPIAALFMIKGADFSPVTSEAAATALYGAGAFQKMNLTTDGYFNPFTSVIDILSGLGWGLGYFGMPHILIRYMSIKNKKEMNRSRVIGTSWTFLILAMATVVAIVGRKYFNDFLPVNPNIDKAQNLIFVCMVREVFKAIPLLSGIILSAILAASMSTADSQLLASASAFASDVYKPVIRKNAGDKEMMWAGRFIVIAISIFALIIALMPGNDGIMGLVENSWGAFGAAFGPSIILALYWKDFNYMGAVAGITTGFLADVIWLFGISKLLADTPIGGLYEIIPAFIIGLIVCIVVSKVTGGASDEVKKLFDDSVEFTKTEANE